MPKRGFVLMETIVVITVLCVVLVVLYGAYSKILINFNKKNLYDNTEYIYKTKLVRSYLEPRLDPKEYNSSSYYVYCRNTLSTKKCYDEDITGNYENDFFQFLGVNAVYITLWNVDTISAMDLSSFEATTQNYIREMNPTNESGFRIIAMFESENDETDKDVFEYATLRFGDRR